MVECYSIHFQLKLSSFFALSLFSIIFKISFPFFSSLYTDDTLHNQRVHFVLTHISQEESSLSLVLIYLMSFPPPVRGGGDIAKY